MNFSEFLLEIAYYYYNNKEQRFGQACFNVLWELDESLAREIHSTELDPFFEDGRVPEFLAKVRDNLG